MRRIALAVATALGLIVAFSSPAAAAAPLHATGDVRVVMRGKMVTKSDCRIVFDMHAQSARQPAKGTYQETCVFDSPFPPNYARVGTFISVQQLAPNAVCGIAVDPTGFQFSVTVYDNGEPGIGADVITVGSAHCPVLPYPRSGTIYAGNIQVHK